MSSSIGGGVHPMHKFHSPRGTLRIVHPPLPLYSRDVGLRGEISFDDEFMYICVKDNLWGRVKLEVEWTMVPDLGPLPIPTTPTSDLGGPQPQPKPPLLAPQPGLLPALVMLFQALRLLTRRATRWATAWIA